MKAAIAILFAFQLLAMDAYLERHEKDQTRVAALESRIGELELTVHQTSVDAGDKSGTLEFCLKDADASYWQFIKNNGRLLKNGNYSAPTFAWDQARQLKDVAIAECRTAAGK